MKDILEEIRVVEENPDGSSVYEMGEFPEEQAPEEDNNFYKNLAINFPEHGRKKLSSYLLDAIEEDIVARKEWLEPVIKAQQYLGIFLEDSKTPTFKGATTTFDTTLLTALIRFCSIARTEILLQSGIAGFMVVGQDNDQLQAIGEKRRDYLNHYLLMKDKAYYSDFERFLYYLGLYGSGFKKVYFDPISKRTTSRFITPQDFIVDVDCTSILESNRLTHVLHLSKREILLNQQNGVYRDVDLKHLKSSDRSEEDDDNDDVGSEGLDLDAYTKRSLFPIYEIHTYLNLEDFKDTSIDNDNKDIPVPYIVTIDKISKEILSIRRNWEEEDPNKERKNYFVQYNYLPGFGIYGMGLSHIGGSNAISLTKILRQLIDAGTFKNFPGGIRNKGFKQQQNDITIGPGQFVEVDTNGIPLQEAFMPLPYSGPDNGLRELRNELIIQTKEVLSTSQLGMLESRADIPTGTMIAALEENKQIQSAVLKSIHYSLARELQLIDSTFKQTLESETFSFGDKTTEITADDYIDEIIIIPANDPSVNSTMQRIMKAESALRTAQSAPEIHNMPEIFKMVYKAQGFDEKTIESFLKPEPTEEEVIPLDPISENQNFLLGKPVKAAMWQFHAGHKLSHALFAEKFPELKPIILDHIKEHDAYEYLIEMQQLLGTELPPLEQIQNPETQNAIAMALAGALEESGITNQEEQPAPLDPNAVMMADIQQKAAEIEAKERIAAERAEVDVFKAQLDFEKQKAKIESNEDIAKLKSETELIKQGVNNE